MSEYIKILRKNISWNFCPRIIVIASDKAKQSISANYLTPAELFSPFAKVNESYSSGDSRGVPIKAPLFKFQDIAEKPRYKEERFRSEVQKLLLRTKPDCEMLRNLEVDWSNRTSLAFLLRHHSWPTFNALWSKMLETNLAEEVGQIPPKAMILLTIVTTEEGDMGGAINEVTSKNIKEIEKLFGVKRYEIDREILRLNFILEDRRNNDVLGEDIRSELAHQARKLYPRSFTRIIPFNRGSENDRSSVPWDNFVYKKRYIKSFELSEYEKVDSNKQGLPRGRFISAEDEEDLRNFMKQAVKNFLLKRFETRFINFNADVIERKKTIRKGFFGLFRKEEKAIIKNGLYVFTEVEQSIKNLADLAFSLGLYDFALKEYKFLHDEIKKKTDYWSALALEKQIYCTLLLKKSAPNRKECRDLENLISAFYDISFGQSHKLVRGTCLINVLLHIEFEQGYNPHSQMIDKLSAASRRFKDYGKVLEVKIMYPIIKEQIARFCIMKRKRSPRRFVYFNIVAASNYVSERSIDMEEHGMACYIIASKFYDRMRLHSWNLILEFAFYNLGGLYLGQKKYENALFYLIKALNNSKMFNGESTDISEKTFKKVVKMIDQARKNTQGDPAADTQNDQVSLFIRNNLKCLEFKDFDCLTEDELVYQLNENFKKEKSAKKNLFGNSLNSSYDSEGNIKIKESSMNPFLSKARMAKLRTMTLRGIKEFSNRKLLDILCCRSIPEKEKCLKFSGRTISQGEKLLLKIQVENHLFSTVGQEVFDSIVPIIAFNPSLEARYTLKDEDVVGIPLGLTPDGQPVNPGAQLDEVITFQVHSMKISPSKTKVLMITITALQQGHLQIRGLKYEFLKTRHTHYLNKPKAGDYLTFRVQEPKGLIEPKIKDISEDMIFGEIQKGQLILQNTLNAPIDDLIIHCEEPLFCGWGLRRFKTRPEEALDEDIPAPETPEDDILGLGIGAEPTTTEAPVIPSKGKLTLRLDLRATMIQVQELCFTLLYKSKGYWRMRNFFIKLNIQSSFRVKCISECIAPQRRLICIDFLYKCGPAINWQDIHLDRIYFLSNCWNLIPGTEVITKKEGIFMIYLTIEKDETVDDELLGLSRKERQVFIKDVNTINISDGPIDADRLKPLTKFLNRENMELCAEASEKQLCKDLIDLAILWRMEGSRTTQGLHSVTSVSVKSIASLSKNEEKNKERVKIYIETNRDIEHNFLEETYCKQNVTLRVDCSNLSDEVDKVILRALEPFEVKGGDGTVYVSMDSQEELYNWYEKHEVVIQRPFTELHQFEWKVMYPRSGIFNLNRFYVRDGDTGKEIFNICGNEQFVVKVRESLM